MGTIGIPVRETGVKKKNNRTKSDSYYTFKYMEKPFELWRGLIEDILKKGKRRQGGRRETVNVRR